MFYKQRSTIDPCNINIYNSDAGRRERDVTIVTLYTMVYSTRTCSERVCRPVWCGAVPYGAVRSYRNVYNVTRGR